VKHLVTVLDWYGPYNYEEALKAARENFSDGVYLCTGKIKSAQGKPKIQYVGIAGKELKTRVGDNHHKLKMVTRERQLWFGEIGSLVPPGKKAKKTNASLDFAEWALVYFLQPPLNSKKKKNPPKRPVTVLNRWWRKDFDTPWIKRPHSDWPDLIDYLGPELKAKVVWFKSPKRVDVN